jgi:hypothetical protein
MFFLEGDVGRTIENRESHTKGHTTFSTVSWCAFSEALKRSCGSTLRLTAVSHRAARERGK